MSERLPNPAEPLSRAGPAVGRTGQPLTLLAREVELLAVHFNFDPEHPDQPAGYEPRGGRPAPAPGEPNHNVTRRGRTELVRQGMGWNNGLRCLYHNADRASTISGHSVRDLDGWGRGARITEPEWTRERSLPVCFVHGSAVWVRAKLGRRRTSGEALSGRLLAESVLPGSGESSLGTGSASFSMGASESHTWVTIAFEGLLPQNKMGQLSLGITWFIAARDAPNGWSRLSATRHRVFLVRDPQDPEYSPGHTHVVGVDGATGAHDPAESPGSFTRSEDGTLTGTDKRMSFAARILAGGGGLRDVASDADVEDIVWRLHVAINNSNPPWFDGNHSIYLTHNGNGARTAGETPGLPLALVDQWLAWVPTRRPAPWNDMSCIGHVQLLKTMAAAFGIFVHRVWVLPCTSRLPDGTRDRVTDEQCLAVGYPDNGRPQMQRLPLPGGGWAVAKVVLADGPSEERGVWENYEACAMTQAGRLLPGGYATGGGIPHRGFRGPRELLRWWTQTSRPNWGRRFLCWAAMDPSGVSHYWDVNGHYYRRHEREEIRGRGRDLPPP